MPFWAQIVLIAFTGFFTALIVTVIFLYALFFPLLNRLFNLKLPTFDLSSLKKEEPEPVKETGRTQKIFERTQGVSAHARYMNVHKDVPTVRLPPTDPKSGEQSLTVSKIDAAVRSTKMAGGTAEAKNLPSARAKDVSPKDIPAKDVPAKILPKAAPAAVQPKDSVKADNKQKGNIETVEIPVLYQPAKKDTLKPAPAQAKPEASKPAPVQAKPEAAKPAPAQTKPEAAKPAPVQAKQEAEKPVQKPAERKKAEVKQDSIVATVELPPQTSAQHEKAETAKSSARTNSKKPQAQVTGDKAAAMAKKTAETKDEQKP